MSEISYDVVVVGSGVAGLSAALSAAEHGAKVGLVERAAEAAAGGNTRYTEAYLRMKTLDEVSEDFLDKIVDDFQGYPDPGVLADTLKDRSRWDGPTASLNIVDAAYVQTLIEQAGPALNWIKGYGVAFDALPTSFPTISTTRLMPVGGGLALVEQLSKACKDKGVSFHYLTTARDLVLEDGQVTGLEAVGPEGAITFHGKVILGCGGYEGNAEMLSRYHGALGMVCRPVARGGHYNKGEGIQMALRAGAATAGNFALFHAEPVDPRSGQPEAAIFSFSYGILVNAEGQRFTDEAPGASDAWYERITRIIQSQTRGIGYLILNAEVAGIANVAASIRTDQPAITGASVEELAGKLGVPAAALAQTLAGYNAACAPGPLDTTAPDAVATTGLTPPKSNWARPVEPPFAAYPMMAANVFTFGGLRTDEQARVIDTDGRVIAGLYAAGEMTGLYYSNYTGSTSVLRGAVFGRIGGRHAATASAS